MSNNLLDYVGLGYFLSKIKTLFVTALGTSGNYLTWTKNGTTNNITVPYSSATASIPFGYTDSTSTASALTATVPGITELKDGVCCMIDNTVIAGSSSGFTLNVNGLGAKTVYSINSTMHSSPTVVTTWNKTYRGFLVYLAAMNNNTGGWILGYLTNTTYSAITAAAIETGTATTARTVTAAVLKAAYNIDTTTGTIKIGANSITPLTQHLDISGKEDKTNKVTSLSSSSTDTQYPSAKCVYDLIKDNCVFVEGLDIYGDISIVNDNYYFIENNLEFNDF